MEKRALNEKAKDGVKREIMDAAREMFVREGFDRVSMRKIAEKTDYSPTTIYLYFEDKADLLHQISERTFRGLAQSVTDISQSSKDPIEKLRLGLNAYINFGLAHPREYELVFISPLPLGKDADFESSSGRAAFDTLRKAVRECADAGVLKNREVEMISQVLWAGIHGVTSLLIKHKEFPFMRQETLIKNTVETLIEGIKKGPASGHY
jgi:AcrR family transcriptional regulator